MQKVKGVKRMQPQHVSQTKVERVNLAASLETKKNINVESKKFPTGPIERTPKKPEYATALATY